MPQKTLVFVCPTCGLKMPWIPLVRGKKECPNCGDPLFIVSSAYVPMGEIAKLDEDLRKLIVEFESCSPVEGLRATAAKCGSKL